MHLLKKFRKRLDRFCKILNLHARWCEQLHSKVSLRLVRPHKFFGNLWGRNLLGVYQGAYDIKIKKECCISMTYHVNTESATQNTVSLYVLFIVKFKNAPENKFQQNFRMKMMDQRINSALYVAKVDTLQFLFSDPPFVSLISGQTDATSRNIAADPTLTSVGLVWPPCCTMFHDAEWRWAKFGFHKRSSSASSNISFFLSCEQQYCISKKEETKYHLRNRTAYRPVINSDRFKIVFVDRLILKYSL